MRTEQTMSDENGERRVLAPAPVRAAGPGALTPRQLPWHPGPGRLDFARTASPDGEDWYLVTLDSGSSRTVVFFQREALEAALRRGLEFIGALPDGLMIATLDDLRGLPPKGPQQ
jgi:hypothetical protein